MQFLLCFQKHFNSSTFFERIFKEEIKLFGNTAGFQHVQHLELPKALPHLAENLARDLEANGCLLLFP